MGTKHTLKHGRIHTDAAVDMLIDFDTIVLRSSDEDIRGDMERTLIKWWDIMEKMGDGTLHPMRSRGVKVPR